MDVQPIPFPWERQQGETSKAYAGFVAYRDLPSGERSLTRAASDTGKSAKWLAEWSARWRWVERAAAWDDEIERRQREQFVKERERMAIRHARNAEMLQEGLLLPVRALADRIQRYPRETLEAINSLSVPDLILLTVQVSRAFPLPVKIETDARMGVDVPPPPQRVMPQDDDAEVAEALDYLVGLAEAFAEVNVEWAPPPALEIEVSGNGDEPHR